MEKPFYRMQTNIFYYELPFRHLQIINAIANVVFYVLMLPIDLRERISFDTF